MTDHNPSRLDLPSAAFYAPTYREPHVDSIEAVQYEQRRISRELEPVSRVEATRQSSTSLPSNLSHASLRSRNASPQASIVPHRDLRQYGLSLSDTSTHQHENENPRGSTRSSIKRRRWYFPITKFWNTHVSITIDEGAHRDHLGKSILPHTFYDRLLTTNST
jgi:hypothetical protein